MPTTERISSIREIGIREILRVHPEWLAFREEWELVDQIRRRKVEFSEHLHKGAHEPNLDYSARVEMTRWVPECSVARNRAISSAFSVQPARDHVAEPLRSWMDDVDRQGQSWAHWYEAVAAPVAADFGLCLVVGDWGDLRVAETADGTRKILTPYLAAYSPLFVRNWEVDPDSGQLSWILIMEDGWQAAGTMGKRIRVRQYRLIDAQGWASWTTRPSEGKADFKGEDWEDDGEPKQKRSGMYAETLVGEALVGDWPTDMSRVPAVPMVLEPLSEMLGASLIRDAVVHDMARLALSSDQTWDLYQHAHPLMAIKSAERPEELRLGSTSYLHLNPEQGEDAKYVTLPSEAFQARERAISQAFVDTYRHSGVDPQGVITGPDQSSAAVSGVSRSIAYQTSEGRHISRLRDRFEHAENEILRMSAEMLGAPMDEDPVTWPDEEAEDPTAAMANFTAARYAWRSPTALRIAEWKSIRAVCGQLSAEDEGKIASEIKTSDPVAPPPAAGSDFDQEGDGE